MGWKQQRVLVTGGSGFLGSSVVRHVPISLHAAIISGLIAAFLVLILPFLLYDIIRMSYSFAINYNEGWNVIHTSRLLDGKPLYLPVNALPLAPVNYPPLSFLIIGTLSYFTGEILLTGRLLSLISLLLVSSLIFGTIANFTSSRSSALLGALLWLALTVQIGGSYVGMYDPQMLGHVFSLGAFYLYSKWIDEVTHQKICMLAFLCCCGLFIKHLLIVVPVALAITLFLTRKRAFWTFALAGILISSLMLFGSWFYGGENVFSNFMEFSRPVLNERRRETILALFLTDFVWVLFLPFVIVVLESKTKWMSARLYFSFSFLLGSYVVGGIGVSTNAWFDFFIAAAIVFGLLAACGPAIIRNSFSYDRLTSLGFGLILVGGLAAVLGSEFMIASYMSPRGMLTLSTVIVGIMLISIRSIAAILGRMLIPDRVTALKGLGLRMLVYGILVVSILPFCINLNASLGPVLNFDRLKQQEEAYRKDVALLQSITGPALYEDLLLGFASGKELLFEPLNGWFLIVSGRIPERILLDPIRQKYFAAIILNMDLEQKLRIVNRREIDPLKPRTSSWNDIWTDNTLRAMRDNYELLDPNGHKFRFFYVPRKIS